VLDVAIVGGGIVGLATALALSEDRPGLRLAVLEAEPQLAAHQTGHNSNVVHSGLYYRPGSMKAVTCVAGREALYRFSAEHDVPHERCGKLVVATAPHELPALDELERRGRENGLVGLVRLDRDGVRAREPHVEAIAGLLVPDTGIVSYPRVATAMAEVVRRRGGEVHTGAALGGVVRRDGGLVLETTAGAFATRHLVGCAGLQSDRVARRCGLDPGVRIVPFRGEYWALRPERRFLVRHLVYPVPDPAMPFLGVHFTRMVDGGVECGPNAVLAFARHGYSWRRVSPRDLVGLAAWPGFWRMGRRMWRSGVGEMHRSLSKRAFVRALQRLVPDLRDDDLVPGGAGVRAQAVDADGALVDDFRLVEADRMIHVVNAPSPAATASLAIGQRIAERAAMRFALPPR
jgi:L-2-hydroxyglutarate oxidase